MGRTGIQTVMIHLGTLAIFTLLGMATGMPPSDCCREKTVGYKTYQLVGLEDTSQYDCLQHCVYQEISTAGPSDALFCFAAGDLEVVCADEPNGETGGGSGAGNEGAGGPMDSPSAVEASINAVNSQVSEVTNLLESTAVDSSSPAYSSLTTIKSSMEDLSSALSSYLSLLQNRKLRAKRQADCAKVQDYFGAIQSAEASIKSAQSAVETLKTQTQDAAILGLTDNLKSFLSDQASSVEATLSQLEATCDVTRPTNEGESGGTAGGSGGGNGGGNGGECTYPADHTMTLYPGPADVCGDDLKFSGLDDATKKALLDKHNELRQKVASGGEAGQPGAANMRKLVWDDELETIAQRWTSQCMFDHDKVRNLCDGTSVGQNAWISGSDYEYYDTDVNPNIGDAVNAWYNEVTNPGFDASNINPYVFGHGYGHYTAVVWAETDRVGCGRVYYEGTDGWFYHLVICNYAVSGNLVGGTMYEVGDKCSNCPAGYSCDATYDGLCTKN